MKAIKTEYKDVQFRSRLEARWALYLSELGFKLGRSLLYEPSGYVFDHAGIAYLPDFFVVPLQTFLEVKPEPPTEAEQLKCRLLANGHEKRVLCVFGHPGLNIASDNGYTHPDAARSGIVWNGDGDIYPSEDHHWFCPCPRCGMVGIAWMGRGARACRNGCFSKPLGRSVDRTQTHDTSRMRSAAEKANGHRFWEPAPVFEVRA